MDYVEKKCSRCGEFSWDNATGKYYKVCQKDNGLCDTAGETYVNGVLSK